MEWKVGMRCWTNYLNSDRQTETLLCEITEIGETDFNGQPYHFAELRYITPFYDGVEWCEYSGNSLQGLSHLYEMKLKELVEIEQVLHLNEAEKKK